MAASQTSKLGLPVINLIRLQGVPILRQLHLEEKLLRTSSDNWCIVNDGTIKPTVVMGISGKPDELLETKFVLRDAIPVVRRFTGGGTVIVDQGTIFVTFVCNKDAVPGLQLYPQPIMSWSGQLYKKVFEGVGDFSLRENGMYMGRIYYMMSQLLRDYVLGERKFGGNAQSITKNRWIHHTSFLWDYEMSNMAYLKLPKRTPTYRQERSHLEFICRMKDYIPRSSFISRTIDAIGSHFVLRTSEFETILFPSTSKFDPTSKLLSREDLGEAISGPVPVSASDSHSKSV